MGSLGKIYVNSKSNVKARLAARGFQENNQDIFCDSPACNKVSMRLILNIIACLKWLYWSIDKKSTILQNKNIDRDVYVKPPKEANCQSDKLCKLNATK